jgi:hypothetical protein
VASLAFLLPLIIRSAPFLLSIIVYFNTPTSMAGLVLVLYSVLLRLSFSSDFERLERKLDIFFFSSSSSKDATGQYQQLHFTAFGAPRPDPLSHREVEIQKLRTSAFTVIDIVSPLVWCGLVVHYVVTLFNRGVV